MKRKRMIAGTEGIEQPGAAQWRRLRTLRRMDRAGRVVERIRDRLPAELRGQVRRRKSGSGLWTIWVTDAVLGWMRGQDTEIVPGRDDAPPRREPGLESVESIVSAGRFEVPGGGRR